MSRQLTILALISVALTMAACDIDMHPSNPVIWIPKYTAKNQNQENNNQDIFQNKNY